MQSSKTSSERKENEMKKETMGMMIAAKCKELGIGVACAGAALLEKK